MLDIYITIDPKSHDEGTWHHIGGIGEDEWAAVFLYTLAAELYDSGNKIREWEERSASVIQRAEAEYPLLARASDYYGGAWYKPGEVERLRAECLRAQTLTSNEVALKTLTELVAACDEALKRGWGLQMAGD
jgi:hypothetical protein